MPDRLLYLPNEDVPGDQRGSRSAFEHMHRVGELGGYVAFSFLTELRAHGQAAWQTLLRLSAALQPSLILWEHPGDIVIPSSVLRALDELPGSPTKGYHEGDLFGRFLKRVPVGARQLARWADVVFLPGLGSPERLFRRLGARDMRLSLNSADTMMFGTSWQPSNERPYDVAMFANNVRGRPQILGYNVPLPAIPGVRMREQLALKLSKALGPKFALYGSGWDRFPWRKAPLSTWRGPVPYEAQEQVARQSWLTVGWNHFPGTPYCFSDRLPNALISGVAHLTNRSPGFDELFEHGKDLYLADSVNQAVAMTLEILSRPRAELITVGLRGQELARRRLTTDRIFRDMLAELRSARAGTRQLTTVRGEHD